MFQDLMSGCLSLVYPPSCYLCNTLNRTTSQCENLCPACAEKLNKNIPPFCQKCSRHVPPDQALCKNCQKYPLHFDFAWSCYLLNPALRSLLHKYKYHHKTELRTTFTKMMIDFISTYNLDIHQFDAIIPIPLFHSKLRERGFNQSLYLAKNIAQAYHISLRSDILIKRRATQNHVDLNQKERWTNIQGAFTIKHSGWLKNKHILIIDDILTTGATVSQASQSLKKAGACTIGILTLAIVP